MTKWELSIFIGGILAVIALVGGTVGHFIGLEQAFIAGLTAALVYVTAFYVYLTSRTVGAAKESVEAANRQAEATKKIVEEIKEARLAASRPMVLQKVAYKLPDARYFSHFLVWNAGNGSAIELVISLLDEKERLIEGRRETFLKPGEETMFKPVSNLAEFEEGKYYLVCVYRDISHLTGEKYLNQTRFPFIIRKASKEGEINVVPGELSFGFGVLEKDVPDTFPRGSTPN